jgi:hypothetical protein
VSTLVELSKSVRVDKAEPSKKRKPKRRYEKGRLTGGRVVSGALFPVAHGVVAGREGHKAQAMGYEAAGTLLGGNVGAGVGTALAHDAGHYKPVRTRKSLVEVAKASERKKASPGRQALGAFFPGIHGAVAGRDGRKAKAAGNEIGGNLLGSVPGRVMTRAAGAAAGRGKVTAALGLAAGGNVATGAGSLGGGLVGTRRAQREGHYKPEPR